MKKTPYYFLKDVKILAALFLAIFFVGVSVYLPNVFNKKNQVHEAVAAEDKNKDDKKDNGKDNYVKGDTNIPLCGFAWGATTQSPTPTMGTGWVSFNSIDCDTNDNGNIDASDNAPAGCPSGITSKYGVVVQPDRSLVGYAWSSNLGWIKFGGLTGMPTSPGNDNGNAKIQDGGVVHGWVRACSGTQNGDCSTMTSRTDGWDGWISLRGSNYGVNYNAPVFQGYSWGGEVVGWIKWDQTSGAASGKGVRHCTATTLPVPINTPPTITLIGDNPLVITEGDNFNDPGAFATDAEDGDITNRIVSSGTVNTNSVGNYTRTYTVTDSGGLSAQTTRTVKVDADVVVGNLGVFCSVTSPAILNRVVVWTATLNPTGVAPYSYSFEFTDGASSETIVYPVAPGRTSAESYTIPKTYNTLGPKSLVVTVTDSSSPRVTVSECAKEIRVITSPIIIEQ